MLSKVKSEKLEGLCVNLKPEIKTIYAPAYYLPCRNF